MMKSVIASTLSAAPKIMVRGPKIHDDPRVVPMAASATRIKPAQ